MYSAIPPGTPLAAASSYSNFSSGFETWIEVLSSFENRLRVDTWSGAINDWLEHDSHPPDMTNSSSPHTYGAVAVTAFGIAFAIVSTPEQKDSIAVWQVTRNLVDWTYNGNIDVGDAWG